MNDELSKESDMKMEILGPDNGMVKQLKNLNRAVTWEEDGITWEPDPRHAEFIVDQLGLTGAKPLKLPGTKEETRRSAKEDKDLEDEVAAVHAKWLNGDHETGIKDPFVGGEGVDNVEQHSEEASVPEHVRRRGNVLQWPLRV